MTDATAMPSAELRETCAQCRNWKAGLSPNIGECRASPPRVFMAGEWPATRWPSVSPDDWCGEFSGPGISSDVAFDVAAAIRLLEAQ